MLYNSNMLLNVLTPLKNSINAVILFTISVKSSPVSMCLKQFHDLYSQKIAIIKMEATFRKVYKKKKK